MAEISLRLDKLMWHLRLFKSRSNAQNAIESGYIRINGNRIMRSSHPVHIGDIVTLPRGDDVWAIQVITIPPRRGPAEEARRHYRNL